MPPMIGRNIDTAVKAAEILPASDVAPVKHGHWIYKKGVIRCTG